MRERGPLRSITYRGFCDPSGGSADSMTLAIGHYESARQCVIIDAVREIRPPFSPEFVVGEFAALLQTYSISTINGDRYAGEWPREQFRKFSIVYEPAEKPKTMLYQDLLPLINSRRIELIDNERMLSQLCCLERRTARGGRDSIDHPPGSHDDLINAVAGIASSWLSRPAFNFAAFEDDFEDEDTRIEDWRRTRQKHPNLSDEEFERIRTPPRKHEADWRLTSFLDHINRYG